MLSNRSTKKINNKLSLRAAFSKTVMTSSLVLIIASSALATSGCNTTQGFKPTASVMVGGHKSI